MIMDYWLPKAIMYGIPEDRFWHMNPRKLEPYDKAYELRQTDWKRKVEIEAWAHGMYVHRAIGCVFSKPAQPYPQKPDSLFEETREVELTDGQKFYAYMLKHNAARRKRAKSGG
jgi:hypothetical protein